MYPKHHFAPEPKTTPATVPGKHCLKSCKTVCNHLSKIDRLSTRIKTKFLRVGWVGGVGKGLYYHRFVDVLNMGNGMKWDDFLSLFHRTVQTEDRFTVIDSQSVHHQSSVGPWSYVVIRCNPTTHTLHPEERCFYMCGPSFCSRLVVEKHFETFTTFFPPAPSTAENAPKVKQGKMEKRVTTFFSPEV